MSRHILEEANIHEAIRGKVSNNNKSVVEEAQRAIEENAVVVIGMAQNPHCKKACKVLDKASASYHYLEHGSYLKEWRKRNALKMWSGWPTFPMVFIKGQLIGGASELQTLIKSKEYEQLVTA